MDINELFSKTVPEENIKKSKYNVKLVNQFVSKVKEHYKKNNTPLYLPVDDINKFFGITDKGKSPYAVRWGLYHILKERGVILRKVRGMDIVKVLYKEV